MSDDVSSSRLDRCGWSSFDPVLFFDEPGRKSRRVGPAIRDIVRDYSYGQHILELCCGGGVLAIFLAESGYDVTALDLGEAMLDQFRKAITDCDKPTRNRLHPVHADVCEFDLGRQFDFIIFEDDGLGYLLSEKDQRACLGRIARHLAPDGRCLLTNLTPDLEMGLSDTYEYDPDTHILTRPHNWTTTDANGQRATVHQGFARRYLYSWDELNRLLQSVGLEIIEQWGDLDRTSFKNPEEHEYVLLIQHAPPKQAGEKAPD